MLLGIRTADPLLWQVSLFPRRKLSGRNNEISASNLTVPSLQQDSSTSALLVFGAGQLSVARAVLGSAACLAVSLASFHPPVPVATSPTQHNNPVVTNESVSRHCQLSPGQGGGAKTGPVRPLPYNKQISAVLIVHCGRDMRVSGPLCP